VTPDVRPQEARVAGPVIAGAMFAAAGELLVAFLLAAVERFAPAAARSPSAAALYRDWLVAGGWAWLPLWGAAVGLATGAWSTRGTGRAWRLALAAGMVALPVVWKPAVGVPRDSAMPRTPAAKTLALRRWAFRDPASVARMVPLSRDPDPTLREQAMLSLGVNLVVADLQGATARTPSKFERAPVRDSLRRRLEEGLRDPVEAVRAEAARALWKSPRAFGVQPAAAETLVSVLDREPRPQSSERLAWLALDAAVGVPAASLRAAAARFAARASDPEQAAAARRAAGEPSAR
jgi:hypothetical protein